MNMHRRWQSGRSVMQRWVIGFVTAIMLTGPIAPAWVNPQLALAQSTDSSVSLERRIYACFDRKQYRQAIELINRHLADNPDDANMLYNLACAHCLLGDFDASVEALHRALKAGFNDFAHLRADPDLQALRDHPTYKVILEKADAVAKASQPDPATALEQWRKRFGTKHYRYETDEQRRINYATALDDLSHREMREMLELQADQMSRTLFGAPPEHEILIAIPTPEDADALFNNRLEVAGMYDHRRRQLVSRDIGSSLRHEFVHAMHHSHMERLGQKHPLWIQEGLASLYEDYELLENGEIRFLPNDRHPIVQRRARAGTLMKWDNLFALTGTTFMSNASHMYPQTRSIFEFLADQGKLEAWYRTYVEHFEEDATGARAFELTFDMPLADIERAWRRWVIEQPAVDTRIREGDASLGIRTRESAANDGVLISSIVRGSAAAKAKLRTGDVIVAIDGQPTRTLSELRRLLASYNVGDEINMRVRRHSEYFTVSLVLQPLRGFQ